jgi:hypothetical protein
MSNTVILTALPVNMSSFKALVTNISPEYSVCIRGRHAVGKSEGVYQAAQEMRSDFYKDPVNCAKVVEAFGGKIKTPDGWFEKWSYDMGIPVLERRLSQMTEGDIIGLPYRHGKDKFDESTGRRLSSASTSFKPCDWLINACEFPVVLFLDERNRALEGVKQAVFQLTDSKAFYGNHLNAETRIVVAENDGDEYQVQQCDPAELSRCVTVTLDPTVKDWIEYASPKCHEATIEFVRQNEHLLENRGNFEPNKKYPDRRSWFKLDQEAQRLGFFNDPTNHLFYVMAGGFLGVETGTKFTNFVKERNREVTAEDILDNWNKAKKRLAGKGGIISNEAYVECSNKLDVFCEKTLISFKQAEQFAYFMKDAPAEVMLSVWASIQKRTENLSKVHKFTSELIVKSLNGEDIENIKLPSLKEIEEKYGSPADKKEPSPSDETDSKAPAKKKRGARQA